MTHTYHLKLRKAHNLIKSKRYAEARTLLRGVDHPQARVWLAKLDMIATKKRMTIKKPLSKHKWLLITIVVLVLLASCYALVINPIVVQMNNAIETACYQSMGC